MDIWTIFKKKSGPPRLQEGTVWRTNLQIWRTPMSKQCLFLQTCYFLIRNKLSCIFHLNICYFKAYSRTRAHRQCMGQRCVPWSFTSKVHKKACLLLIHQKSANGKWIPLKGISWKLRSPIHRLFPVFLLFYFLVQESLLGYEQL